MKVSKDLLPLEARENALKKLSEFLRRHPRGLPMDPEGDMKVHFLSLLQLSMSISFLLSKFNLSEKFIYSDPEQLV